MATPARDPKLDDALAHHPARPGFGLLICRGFGLGNDSIFVHEHPLPAGYQTVAQLMAAPDKAEPTAWLKKVVCEPVVQLGILNHADGPFACVCCAARPASKVQLTPAYYPKVAAILSGLTFPICRDPKCGATMNNEAQLMMKAVMPKTEYKSNKLRVCATCDAVGSDARKLKQCTKCKVVYYCNADCQRQHWPLHKHYCAAPTIFDGDEKGSK
jgi:hypothetical protein